MEIVVIPGRQYVKSPKSKPYLGVQESVNLPVGRNSSSMSINSWVAFVGPLVSDPPPQASGGFEVRHPAVMQSSLRPPAPCPSRGSRSLSRTSAAAAPAPPGPVTRGAGRPTQRGGASGERAGEQGNWRGGCWGKTQLPSPVKPTQKGGESRPSPGVLLTSTQI